MSFKIRSAYFAAAISAALTVAAVASANYKVAAPKIVMRAKGPLGLKIVGNSSKLDVAEDDKSVTFTTELSSIKTGNDTRDSHMKERFEAAKFNAITLTVPKDKIAKGGTIPGELKFHGVKKPVKVKYEVSGKHVKSNFGFNVNQHGVEEKKLCAIETTKTGCADPDVTIEVEFDLKD
jgi:polyisoprenoid-binding protein YceI